MIYVTARRFIEKVDGDTSVMTYRGHSVLHTLIRCRFSPEFTTGQRYIYSGCATGAVVSKSDSRYRSILNYFFKKKKQPTFLNMWTETFLMLHNV